MLNKSNYYGVEGVLGITTDVAFLIGVDDALFILYLSNCSDDEDSDNNFPNSSLYKLSILIDNGLSSGLKCKSFFSSKNSYTLIDWALLKIPKYAKSNNKYPNW